MRRTYNLPARLGGLGIQDPTAESDIEYDNSNRVTAQLTSAIYNQHNRLQIDKDLQSATMKNMER